jgi:hypothetical protein
MANIRIKVKLDEQAIAKLNEKLTQAFQETVEVYAEQCKAEIQDPKWEWPRQTKRSNGEVVGSPRDILDTGELLESQQDPIFSEDGNAATIVWTADHAGVVHEGEAGTDRTIKPARPWTETAAEAVDFEQVFQEKLDALG